jgi:hypothetical protein
VVRYGKTGEVRIHAAIPAFTFWTSSPSHSSWRQEMSVRLYTYSSVVDPDLEPDPQDPHVFGPPGSGSDPVPFLIKVLSGLK